MRALVDWIDKGKKPTAQDIAADCENHAGAYAEKCISTPATSRGPTTPGCLQDSARRHNTPPELGTRLRIRSLHCSARSLNFIYLPSGYDAFTF